MKKVNQATVIALGLLESHAKPVNKCVVKTSYSYLHCYCVDIKAQTMLLCAGPMTKRSVERYNFYVNPFTSFVADVFDYLSI